MQSQKTYLPEKAEVFQIEKCVFNKNKLADFFLKIKYLFKIADFYVCVFLKSNSIFGNQNYPTMGECMVG